MHRRAPSRPLREILAKTKNAWYFGDIILDYGCGRGADVEYLRELGFTAAGYDPNHAPALHESHPLVEQCPTAGYDVIFCTFVLNVVECPGVRQGILERILRLLAHDGVAYVTVRDDVKKSGPTWSGSFQWTWAGAVRNTILEGATPWIHRKGAFVTYRLTAPCAR